MPPNIKKQRCDENTSALKANYEQFCLGESVIFHLFTNDRHNVLVHVVRAKEHDGHLFVADINGDILLLQKKWILGAHGYLDFQFFIFLTIERARKIQSCKHCSKLCKTDVCVKCQSFMVAPMYAECIACKTEEHPIAWLCLTCIDAYYCTLCYEKMYETSSSGIVVCPICKSPNQTKVNIDHFIDSEQGELPEDEEFYDDTLLTPTLRVLNYIKYYETLGQGKIILKKDSLMELSHLEIKDLAPICASIARNGHKTYLSSINEVWIMCVVLDEVEDSVSPLPNATLFSAT